MIYTTFYITFPIEEKEEKIIKSNKDRLKHLNKYCKINKNDPIILNESTCIICMDNYKIGEFKRVLNCNHTFHKKCIDKWLLKSDKMLCPLCRENIKK